MISFSFPGLGIPEVSINPILFTLPLFGGLEIRIDGILLAIGLVLGILYAYFSAKRHGIGTGDFFDLTVFTLIAAVIGGRGAYLLFAPEPAKSFYDVIALWEGGFDFFGALLFGALTLTLLCRFKKLSSATLLDSLAPALLIGQIFGCAGALFHGTAYGTEIVKSSSFTLLRMGIRQEGYALMQYYHPVFLYELLWILPAFFVLHALASKKRFEGQTFLSYLAWYGLGISFIEGMREKSLTLGVFRTAQVAGFFCFAIGTVLLVLRLYRAKRERLAKEEYRPAYERFARPAPPEEKCAKDKPEAPAPTERDMSKQYQNLFGNHPADDNK